MSQRKIILLLITAYFGYLIGAWWAHSRRIDAMTETLHRANEKFAKNHPQK